MKKQNCFLDAPRKFKPILTWLENNYIGKFEVNSQTVRKTARFPIDEWNLHDRIKKGIFLNVLNLAIM